MFSRVGVVGESLSENFAQWLKGMINKASVKFVLFSDVMHSRDSYGCRPEAMPKESVNDQ